MAENEGSKSFTFRLMPEDQQALKALIKELARRSEVRVSQVAALRWALHHAVQSFSVEKPATPKQPPAREYRPTPKPGRHLSGVIGKRTEEDE